MKRRKMLRRKAPLRQRSPLREGKYHTLLAPMRTYAGVQYDSRTEAKMAFELDVRRRIGEIASWRRQVPVALEVGAAAESLAAAAKRALDAFAMKPQPPDEYAALLDLSSELLAWRAAKPAHVCRYVIDFEVTHNDGTRELIEMKGFETDVWRLKHRLFLATWGAAHPEVRYTVVRLNSPNAVGVFSRTARRGLPPKSDGPA